jgi:glycine/D-amino acid oxidase-like deaminating enzyme
MSREADVVIVGGGLHGCSAALQLALRGRRVIVLERQHVARHASGINAGGVRTLGRHASEIALSVMGMELWRGIEALVGDDCGYSQCGQVRVAETAEELAKLEARAAATRRLGFEHEEVIDAAETRRLLPALGSDCAGALVVRTDGAADPYRTTAAFGARARELGVQIVEGAGVTAVERRGDHWVVRAGDVEYRAPVVVNAAGAWAAQLARLAGDEFALSTRASMMIVTERLPAFVTPVVSAVGRKLSFKQTPAGTVLIGGGQQGRVNLEREQGFVDIVKLAKSARAAAALFPQVRNARIVRSWCGIEAETPDAIPVIGLSLHAPGLVHTFGYSGHGFQLGPICGVAVADLAMHGETRLPIAPFTPARFATTAAAA